MINFKMSLCQVILALIGIHFQMFVFNVLLVPPNEELAIAISSGFPTDKTTATDMKRILAALNSTLTTNPYYVHILVGTHLVARHLFPPCNAMLLLKAFMTQFHYVGILIYCCDEFHLNVLACALYGPWLGLLFCCTLTTVAAAISLATVTLILHIFDRIQVANVENRRIAIQERVRFFAEQVALQNEAEQHRLLVAQLEEEPIENQEELLLREVLDESVFMAVLAMFVVRFLPFIPSWQLSLVFGVLGVPVHLALVAIGFGYAPFACHCASVASRLHTMDTFADVYSTGFWSHWIIFLISAFFMFHSVSSQWEEMRRRAGVQDEDVFGEFIHENDFIDDNFD